MGGQGGDAGSRGSSGGGGGGGAASLVEVGLGSGIYIVAGGSGGGGGTGQPNNLVTPGDNNELANGTSYTGQNGTDVGSSDGGGSGAGGGGFYGGQTKPLISSNEFYGQGGYRGGNGVVGSLDYTPTSDGDISKTKNTAGSITLTYQGSSGDITFSSTVNGAQTLTVNAEGDITF